MDALEGEDVAPDKSMCINVFSRLQYHLEYLAILGAVRLQS